MDFQNRVGSKFGGGGPASTSETNRQRKERLMALAMETIDLAKMFRVFPIYIGTDMIDSQIRAAREAKDTPTMKPMGRPGYKVTKQRDAATGQYSLFFQVDYPEIAEDVLPRYRFMSAYEQRVEAPDSKYQYILFAAEPYETIAFKVPSSEVDQSAGKLWTRWNPSTKQYFMQFHFKTEQVPTYVPKPIQEQYRPVSY
eukprot:gene4058-6477_t